MDRQDLLKLIADDPLDLLKLDPDKPAPLSDNDRLLASFQEINHFVSLQGREPELSGDIKERKLHDRLVGIRSDQEKTQQLKTLDIHGLLDREIKAFDTIDDVIADDDLGLLEDDIPIFKLDHVPKSKSVPDYVASRKPCADFEKFQPKFSQCQADLAAGSRRLVPFRRVQTIDERHFYVLKGQLVFVAEVGEREINGVRTNPRLRCIFENGTESDLLLHSLAAALYKDGRRVTDYQQQTANNEPEITAEDQEAGIIYILTSCSEDPKIRTIKDLYKIGFSTVPMEERIKNAATEPTYLMAQVSVVATYQCFNMNIQKFEGLLHTFFASSCLNLDVFDSHGQRHSPREWFIAPLAIIEQAIHLLLNGQIVHHRYDPVAQKIEVR